MLFELSLFLDASLLDEDSPIMFSISFSLMISSILKLGFVIVMFEKGFFFFFFCYAIG